MAPSKNTPESELSESSTTRHEPACLMEMHDSLKHAEDDSADETSTTHHVPFLLAEELTSDPDLSLGAMKPVEEAPEQEGDEGQRELNVKRNEKGEEERQKSEELPLPPSPSPKSNSPQDAASPAEQEYYDQREEEELSLRIHKKVADIAAKAYRRASAQSAVLTQSKLQDIALIRMDELELGDFLGKGSFSDVHEITKISIKKQEGENDSDEKQNEQGGDGGQESKTGSIAGRPPGGRRSSLTNTSSRKLLAKNYCRHESGTFRYAVKFLKESIRSDPNKYAVGTADLVIEGMFLASLSHPNIIRVRGLPRGGVQSLVKTHRSELGENSVGKGYFLVLDRLFDTLGDRIYKEWVETHADKKDWMGGTVRSPKNKAERKMNLAERLRVAFDVCGALKYLHEKKIIYRDLKPENLGFDVRGDIKLFDLGLVKELNPNTEDKNGNYRLSMAGTPRYMAPEVGRYKPYNLSADVYSLSMLLYEVVTVSKPLRDFTYTQLKEDVFQSGYRPPLKKVWYKPMRNLIEAGWSQNPKKRPTMAVMYDELKTAYTTLGKVSVEEVNHSRRRSTFVSKKVDLVSVRHLVTRSSDVEENEVE